MYDRGTIKGLAKDSDTFMLTQTEFDDVPLCFLVMGETSVWQYWTLNKRLHRINGPAYVSYNETSKFMERGFYFNGLSHSNGPANEKYFGYEIDSETLTDHVVETWNGAEFKWMLYGENKKFFGRWGLAKGGQCYRRRSDRKFDAPDDFSPTFWADELIIEWTGWIYDPNRDKDGVAPQRLVFTDFSEIYENGKLKKRSCSNLEGSWFYAGKLYSWHNDRHKMAPWVERFNDRVKKNLLKEIGIWEGPAYKDGEDEFYFLSEFNACYEK